MSKEYKYEILDDGYRIIQVGNPFCKIVQKEPSIKYPELSYEENAKKHIEELERVDLQMEQEKSLLDQIEKELEQNKEILEEQNTMIIDNTYRVTMLELMQSGMSL